MPIPEKSFGVVAGEEQRAGARSPPREQFAAPSPRHLRELRVDQFCSAGERARRALRFPRHASPLSRRARTILMNAPRLATLALLALPILSPRAAHAQQQPPAPPTSRATLSDAELRAIIEQ